MNGAETVPKRDRNDGSLRWPHWTAIASTATSNVPWMGSRLRCTPSDVELAGLGWQAIDEVVQGRSSQMLLRKCEEIGRGARAQTELARRRRRSENGGRLLTWTYTPLRRAVVLDEAPV